MVVMWQLDEQEFWDVFEDDSCPLHPLGLQQLILDIGIDPQSALPEDGWFVNTVETAINKLLLKTSGSEASDTNDEHITLHDEIILDSDDTGSCVSSIKSSDSFASANMSEVESRNYFTNLEA
ncbi:hypothetical protein GIB67_000339 [Kingdonia uniflora]|uniref:Uncharacterized protein n=1 Tax=Kingdonia uniflora TaxID=39325 RepID=A0A7J7LC98_9MAGN|nr:hypothetical protein GIB67_000339 [Kingdonia uniflora]